MAFTAVTPLRIAALIGRSLPSTPINNRRSAAVTRRVTRAQLIGIPENLRSNNLDPSPHEVLLAELRFSDPARLPALVQNSLNMLDDEFYTFIESKIADSADLEERDSLAALRDAITYLMQQMLDQAASSPVDVSSSEVPGAAPTADSSKEASANAATNSYDELIDSMLASYKREPNEEEREAALKTAVDINYHRIDLAMLERLSERIVGAGEEAPLLARIRDGISNAMNERVTTAMESVKQVLTAGSLVEMKKSVNALASQGKLDDAFTLLLQANLDEAKKAGAQQAAEIISGVLDYATDVKDTQVAPEIRLIRTLLRTEDEDVRMDTLTSHLQPGTAVALTDGTETTGSKVDGKKFVDALRTLIEEYGNVDEQFVLKLSKIGEESESVARKMFDMEGKDIEQYQHEAFHKRTVSVWDLEEYEHQETMEGRKASWEGKLGDIPKEMGFGPDGKLTV